MGNARTSEGEGAVWWMGLATWATGERDGESPNREEERDTRLGLSKREGRRGTGCACIWGCECVKEGGERG